MEVKGIGSWITRYSETQPEKLAVVSGDTYLTYRQFNERINQLANGLIELGVRKGDRVNALLLNTNEILESLFACAKIGAIFVPINFRLSADEVEYIIRNSSGSLFIYDYRLVQIADAIDNRIEHLHYIVQVGIEHESHLNYEQRS